MEIYSRDKERKFISNFINSNMSKKRSSLLYLCGHPGTGKTSTLNYVLTELLNNVKLNIVNEAKLFMFNAMSYRDVKAFSMQLLEEL